MATRREMIDWAAAQLAAGVLASALPARLIEKYQLTPSQARQIARQALAQRAKKK